MAGTLIETELENRIWAVTRNVRRKSKPVGRVCAYGMRPPGGFQPFDWWLGDCTILADRVDRHPAFMVVRGEEEFTFLVRCNENRVAFQEDGP